MDLMNQVYHDLKFHINHFIVRYKQKYYSMDNNPRVIHTKLENQQLLSLRTFPNDRHLFDNGQHFLHLTKEPENQNEVLKESPPQSMSLPSPSSSLTKSFENVAKRDFTAFENYKNVTFRTHNSLILKKNYSQPNLVDGYFLSFRLDLEMSGSSSDADGQEEESREAEGNNDPVDTSEPALIGFETNTPEISDFTASTPCTCQCHTPEKSIPESTISSTKRTNHVKDKLYNFVMNSLPRVTTSTNEMALEKNEVIAATKEIGNKVPILQKPDNSIDEIMSIKQDNNRIWKLVLNDISLSAARLSTGSSNIPMVNNQNIRGDFIDTKITNNENEDIFTSKGFPQ